MYKEEGKTEFAAGGSQETEGCACVCVCMHAHLCALICFTFFHFALQPCLRCAMFVFLPEGPEHFICITCMLVLILEEKTEGLDAQVC